MPEQECYEGSLTFAESGQIDRPRVPELAEIASQAQVLQGKIDEADQGLNPLGLARGVVPFDIDPSLLDPSTPGGARTHFEQVYERATAALRNAVRVFDHANRITQMLRKSQDYADRLRAQRRGPGARSPQPDDHGLRHALSGRQFLSDRVRRPGSVALLLHRRARPLRAARRGGPAHRLRRRRFVRDLLHDAGARGRDLPRSLSERVRAVRGDAAAAHSSPARELHRRRARGREAGQLVGARGSRAICSASTPSTCAPSRRSSARGSTSTTSGRQVEAETELLEIQEGIGAETVRILQDGHRPAEASQRPHRN